MAATKIFDRARSGYNSGEILKWKSEIFFNLGAIAYAARLAVFLLVIASISYVSGQTNSGRISGTVTDSAGAAIPNANVTVKDPTTSFSRIVVTDDSGLYTVTNIPVGAYSVVVEMANFKKSLKSGNQLSADSRLTVDVKLDAGQISEMVEVTSVSGETVNSTSGEVGKVIDNQQISNLALNGRNYYQLLSIIPGAVVTADMPSIPIWQRIQLTSMETAASRTT